MHIVAVDVGTSALKAALFDTERLSFRARATAGLELLTPKPGHVELDPERLWESFADAVRRLIDESGVAPRDVLAISMCTQMAGVVALGKGGEPLTNILTWLDSRAAGHPKKLFEGALRVSGYNALLLAKLLRISGGAPGKLGKDPLSKYTWLAAEEPGTYGKVWKLLDVKGYLLYALTGRPVITVDEASITWLVDTRDPLKVGWSGDLLREFSLSPDKLPEIVATTDIVGALTAKAAQELNLHTGVKVVAGCGDVPATALGSGAVGDYETHAYVGTGNWFASHVPRRKLDVAHYMGCILSAVPGRYLLVAEQQNGAVAIDHFSRVLGYSSYDEVDEAADRAIERGVRPIFLPWLYGERSPVEAPYLRAALVNIQPDSGRDELVGAVVEGLALNMKWEFVHFRRLLGREPGEIPVVGGGALYNSLCRALASALETRIVRPVEPREATLRGAAVLGLVATGLAGFEVAKKLSRFERVFEPDPKLVELYRRKFAIFTNIYEKLKGVYEDINRPPT